MTLYIEYVLLDNIVIDYLLIKLMATTFKEKYSRIRIALSLVVGVVGAIFLPYIIKYRILSIFYRLLICTTMILLLKRYVGFVHYIKHLLAFIGFTALLGGLILGTLNLFNIPYTISGVMYYSLELPMGLFVLLMMLGLLLIKKILLVVSKGLKEQNYIYDTIIEDNGVAITTRGYVDSGNMININGEGVSVISCDTFLKLHSDVSLLKLLYGKVNNSELKGISYIRIDGMSQGKEYLSFVVDKLKIGSIEYHNKRVAVANKNFGEFDCILSKDFIGGHK